MGLHSEAWWGATCGQVGAKMALSWPTWSQDVPKMTNLEPKMGNLARLWEHLGEFFLDLRRDLSKTGENKKKTSIFMKNLIFAAIYSVSSLLGVQNLCFFNVFLIFAENKSIEKTIVLDC